MDHTEDTVSLLLERSVYSAVAQQRKLFDCCLRIRCGGNVFTLSLPSNERLSWLHYSCFRCHVTLLNIASYIVLHPLPGWVIVSWSFFQLHFPFLVSTIPKRRRKPAVRHLDKWSSRTWHMDVECNLMQSAWPRRAPDPDRHSLVYVSDLN
jgi:hypothetical protein